MDLVSKIVLKRLYDQNFTFNFCLLHILCAHADLHRLEHLNRGRYYFLLLLIETLWDSLLLRVIVIFHDGIIKITLVFHIDKIAILQVLFSVLLLGL
jgi:hypothetical protein